MPTIRLPRAVRAATLLTGALLPGALLVGTASAASGTPEPGEACAADEVTVVVEPGDLAVEAGTGCAPPGTAGDVVAAAGWTLTPHPQQREFLCQVDGEPADGDCLRTDRYWSLFVSDGGAPWVYATLGIYSQPVEAGDSVALVWQQTNTRELPAAAPGGTPAVSGEGTVNPQTRPPVGETGESDNGLPGWVPPAALGVLVVAGGVVVLVRRRSGSS
ncbi:hypothetical protein [Nocardioides insulae]|uniref:hypothetical protein n=1 Tax=Nocardioides insulae TaxID=394734 RepID=UPI000419C39B|nr:hypothetical protein [Nocardioides insulae]